MEQEYKFQNRYGDSIVLTKVRDNTYKLTCKDNEYIRFGLYNYEDGGYYFVDPPGGPFMKVGAYKLGDKVLSKIEMEDKDIILTFCSNNTLYDEAAAELNRIITEYERMRELNAFSNKNILMSNLKKLTDISGQFLIFSGEINGAIDLCVNNHTNDNKCRLKRIPLED